MRDLQHNICNVLYTVKLMIESHLACLKEGRFEGMDTALQLSEEVLEKAYDRVVQALDITKRLGFLLRADERGSNLDCKASVKAAWHEVRRMLRKKCPMPEVEILERIPEDFPLIKCNENDLQEILYNLSQNAIQAMNGRGKLILRVTFAFSAREESFAVITLADTGPGIPERNLSHLFQPFFTTKPQNEGNGLGLYLAKALVETSNGRISVSSYEGFGTAFTLEFPIYRKEEESPRNELMTMG